jgi:serine/threonine-protein kinase RsbW
VTEQENGRGHDTVIRLANRLSELDRLHAFFDELGGRSDWPDKLKWDLTLSCEELLTNTINYGFPRDDGNYLITVAVKAEPGRIEITLEDEGIAFNPLEQEQPDIHLGIEERDIGGLGIFFVRKLMSEVVYERTDAGNRIVLRKFL